VKKANFYQKKTQQIWINKIKIKISCL
jgi:hypothetical protein